MRTIRIVLALATMFISASSARAALEPTRTVQVAAEFEPVPSDSVGQPLRGAHDISRIDQQLRYAHHTRIDIDGRTYELINPRVGAQGIAYERIPGFPKTRPALVAGAGWDSLAIPPNPIPWSRIDRIERGFPSGTHGARNGALIGLLGGVVMFAVGLANADDYGYGALGLVSAPVWSPLLGAFVGSALQTTRWEQVYPEAKPQQR